MQSKNLQKQNGLSLKGPDSWKASVHVYSSTNKKPIEQVAVGYRHSAILHSGKILWGKNKDDELSPPKLKDKDNISFFTHKFIHVACGLDYTMAIDQAGKLLAWGSPSMAQVSGFDTWNDTSYCDLK
jgi:alpha-tubulin suppressor-like RCC1 family protein